MHSQQIEQQIATFEQVKHEYPHLAKAGSPIEFPAAAILGRIRYVNCNDLAIRDPLKSKRHSFG